MIRQIIELLNALPHYKQSENIEIAKGKYELPTSINKGWEQIKRTYQWHKKSK
jgi:hypothetical protein